MKLNLHSKYGYEVGNGIKQFHNYFDVQPTHMAIGSSSSAIHGYGDALFIVRRE
jgi:hypothetical protein